MYATPIIRLALMISAKAHRKQNRKGGDTPYVTHPVTVMMVLVEHTNDEAVLAAALLHDVLEDCPDEYSEAQMRHDFGDVITDTVKAVTKDSSIKEWRERNIDYLDRLRKSNNGRAIMICAADKISNLVDILEDHEVQSVWKKFNAGKDDQLWWYNEVYKLISEIMPDHPMTKGLNKLVDELAVIVYD